MKTNNFIVTKWLIACSLAGWNISPSMGATDVKPVLSSASNIVIDPCGGISRLDCRNGYHKHVGSLKNDAVRTPDTRLALADREDNQKLVEIIDRAGTDPLGQNQLMKEALQASDLSLTASRQGSTEFVKQFRKIIASSVAAFRAIGSSDPNNRREGATAALQLKSRQLDVIAQAIANLRTRNDPESKALLDDLYVLATARSKLSFDESDKSEQITRVKRIAELERHRDRLQQKLIRVGDRLQSTSEQPVTIDSVQSQLGKNDVLIEWTRVTPFNPTYVMGKGRAWDDPRYIAFLIVPDKPPEVVDLGPAEAIEQAVHKLLTQIRVPAERFDTTNAKFLFNLVIRPLLAPMAGLQANVKLVHLAPDGALNLIPIAALVDEQEKFFGDRFLLNYLTSGRDLLHIRGEARGSQRAEQVLVIAAPDYSAADDESLAIRKRTEKRQARDVTDLINIAKANEQPPQTPPLSSKDVKNVERLKQLSEDHRAGKNVDKEETKKIVSELKNPLIANIFNIIGAKAQKIQNIIDQQNADFDEDAAEDEASERRVDRKEALIRSSAQGARADERPVTSTKENTAVSHAQQPISTEALDLVRRSKRFTFAPLPGTLAEGEILKGIFGLNATQIFTGIEATEALVKRVHGPRVLHIATHGFYLPALVDNPVGPVTASAGARGTVEEENLEQIRLGIQRNPMLRSGIALAGANLWSDHGDDDGILTAEEVAQLDLQGTELVVLSACETAIGDVATGEGVYGLRRALMLAGAKSQLVSLWKVSDQGTQELMSEYYKHLRAGEGRVKSLQLAQEKLRRQPTRAHPYFWAAFIPLGDWHPITKF